MNPWLKQLDDHRERAGLDRLMPDADHAAAVHAGPSKARGLGDTVEKLIDKATLGQGKRIAERAANAMGKKSCGCAKRRDWLNRVLPYRRG
ncbi:MAG: hypothetical protein AAGI68_16745 [Planctomycetota bacterium]